jgi:hypothetical protein
VIRDLWDRLTADPVRQIDREIGEKIEDLHLLLEEAETIGAQFQPCARLARVMLRSIAMR